MSKPLNRQAETAFIRARTALYIDQPFYGILALRLEAHQDYSVDTLQVSNTAIYYNPDYFLSLDEELQMSAVCHEVQHPLLDHINRCGPRDPDKWGAAIDYVVNANLKADGMKLKDTWLYNKAFEGMSADHIYTLLPDQPPGPGKPGQQGGGYGAQDTLKPGDPNVIEVEAAEWKIAGIQAAIEAKKQGKMPGSMISFVEELKTGKLNWAERLRRFAMLHSKNTTSWNRLQRRMLPFGYCMPSRYSRSMGLIVNSIDTSGSVDQFQLDAFGSEINSIKLMARPKQMTNIYCDARVQRVDTYDEYQVPEFKMPGRGGTDFRPPFEYVRKHDLKPACFIYLTDGEGPFPKQAPNYPVMWVMTTNVIAPFGETIKLDV